MILLFWCSAPQTSILEMQKIGEVVGGISIMSQQLQFGDHGSRYNAAYVNNVSVYGIDNCYFLVFYASDISSETGERSGGLYRQRSSNFLQMSYAIIDSLHIKPDSKRRFVFIDNGVKQIFNIFFSLNRINYSI